MLAESATGVERLFSPQHMLIAPQLQLVVLALQLRIPTYLFTINLGTQLRSQIGNSYF